MSVEGGPMDVPVPVEDVPVDVPRPVEDVPVDIPRPVVDDPVDTPTPVVDVPVDLPRPVEDVPVDLPTPGVDDPVETPTPSVDVPVDIPVPGVDVPVDVPVPGVDVPVDPPTLVEDGAVTAVRYAVDVLFASGPDTAQPDAWFDEATANRTLRDAAAILKEATNVAVTFAPPRFGRADFGAKVCGGDKAEVPNRLFEVLPDLFGTRPQDYQGDARRVLVV
ncbi:MAG: hypothetical protein LBS56_09195, partial [Propionibacteriaceae bacterium]|nr:hypothetical protein [Propionibacteriaceae bacterium]